MENFLGFLLLLVWVARATEAMGCGPTSRSGEMKCSGRVYKSDLVGVSGKGIHSLIFVGVEYNCAVSGGSLDLMGLFPALRKVLSTKRGGCR